ncbi:MAG TPA: PEP-utilizing enzyme, partial [Mycobacteriales bacterium]
LQARPMTALPEPADWTPPGPGLWARNFRLGEWLPDPMTPLFATWLLPAIEDGYLAGMRATVGAVVPFRYAAVNGWYYNATPIPSIGLLARALRDSRGRIVPVLVNALVRVGRNPVAADRAMLSTLHRRWRDGHLPDYRRMVSTAEAEVDHADPPRLRRLVDELGHAAGQYLWFLAIVGGSAWKIEGCLTRFCRQHLATVDAVRDGAQVLLRGLPGAEPVTPPHAVHSVDWYHPTAGEHPDPAEPADQGSRRHRQLAADRQAAEIACRQALATARRTATRFDALLEVAQRYAVIREEQARDLTLAWPVLRRCAHRLGEDLHARGQIPDPADVFFLTRAELDHHTTSYTCLIDERHAQWHRQARLSPPLTLGTPARLIGDPIAHAVHQARGGRPIPDGAIVGHPASTGRATGRIRLIDTPDQFDQFTAGEILLARATAPAWTPLFARAAAVITDGGTLAAHASLVAREYGIPAVVGTGDATRRLRTGQMVTVDGTTGIVTPATASGTRAR